MTRQRLADTQGLQQIQQLARKHEIAALQRGEVWVAATYHEIQIAAEREFEAMVEGQR